MMTLNAKDILNMTEEQVWLLDEHEPDTKILVSFDDVDFPCLPRHLIFSWYIWEVHRRYPKIPILSHHYTGYYPFDTKFMPKILTVIGESIREHYELDHKGTDALAQTWMQVNNNVYNMGVRKLGAYIQTTDARSYMEVLLHDRVKKLRAEVKANPVSKMIQNMYRELPQMAMEEGFMDDNSLIRVIRIKSVPLGQINQSVGARGMISDIDGTVFPNLVTDCFGTGLNDIADFIIESRSAAKSLFYQKSTIRNTEYFNRRLQMQNQTITYLIPGDCCQGESKENQAFLPWQVQPGDLPALEGRYYWDEEKQGLNIVRMKGPLKSSKLSGTQILLRSPTMCKYSQFGLCCETCFGELAKTIPDGTNIGHLAAFLKGEKISQRTLSIKHLDQITEIEDIYLDKSDLKFVRLSTERNELIKFNKELKSKRDRIHIMLHVDEVVNLTQAMSADNISDLSVFKVSQLKRIGVRMDIPNGNDEEISTINWVTVSGPSRPSSLSASMLKYIKKYGYVQNDPRFIEVSLKEWDFDLPAFKLPQKQVSQEDFMKQIADMIESDPKKGIKRQLTPSVSKDLSAYIRHIYEFASQQIHIPLVYYEITALAVLIRSAAENDYRFADDFEKREFASSASITFNRSVGSGLAYQQQTRLLYSSDSYNKAHRVRHPMDKIFKPDPNDELYVKWEYIPPESE